MVIVLARQSPLADLFQYGYQAGNQVFEGLGVHARHGLYDVERGSHHGGVAIAQHPSHLLDQLLLRHDVRGELVKSVQRDDGLLPHRLGGVLQQASDLGADGADQIGGDEAGYGEQGAARFEEVG